MNRNRVYFMFFLSLLLGGCNTQTAPSPNQNISENVPSTAQQVVGSVMSSGDAISKSQTTLTHTSVSRGSGGRIEYVENPLVLEEGMFHIDQFMKTLKPTLNSTLAQDKSGVVAMGVCQSLASKMVEEYNGITPNVTIRRTALKYRNPQNKPDKVDEAVMYQLESSKSFKPVAVDMGNSYRVYKPMFMEQSCLKCHGDRDDIAPQVLNMIKQKYPNDMATGFKPGEFRGVTVAEFPKEH